MAEPLDPFSCPLHFVATHGNDSREARALRRAVERGHMTRVSPGAYTPTSTWLSLDGRGRHVVLTRAVLAGLTAPSVVSHRSAVAVHGLPQVSRQYEPLVEVIDERRSAVRRSRLLHRRPGLLEAGDMTLVNRVPVTSITRTAVDVAKTASFADAVLCVDAVLRRLALPLGHRTGPAVDTLLAQHRATLLDMVGPSGHPGGRAARRVIDFASPHAENGGESLLRVVLHELGAPTPELQRVFTRNGKFVARCDAYLAEFGTVVEFDGFVKLTDPSMLAGKTPEEALRDRVRRDKRLLALPEVKHVIHCYYFELVQPHLLAALLSDADVVLSPRRRAGASRIATRRFDGARG